MLNTLTGSYRPASCKDRGVTDARRAARIFTQSGVIWQLGTQGYWLLFFVRLVVDLDLDPLQLVLLGTAKEIAVLGSEIPTGVVADLYSRKWSVIAAFAISGTAVIAAGLIDNFVLLMFSSALWGFGLTFRSGAETAWLTDELGPSALAEPVIIRRANLQLVAVVFGAVAAVGLAYVLSLGAALVILGSMLVAQSIRLALTMPETGFQPAREGRRNRFTDLLKDGYRSIRQISPLRILFLATVLAGFGSEAVDRLYVRRIDDLFALGGVVAAANREVLIIGTVLVAQSLLAAIILRAIRHRLGGSALVPALTVLFTITAIGVLLLARVDLLWVAAVGLTVQGTARSIARPVTEVWTNAHAEPASRATVHSFIGQAHSLGEITGGLSLGFVASVVGLPIALTGSALLYGLAALTASRTRPRS